MTISLLSNPERLRILVLTNSRTICIVVNMIRHLYKRVMQRIDSPEAIVITGMRRVGKTTLLKQIYENLSTNNKIFLDLENPFNRKFFESDNYDEIAYELRNLGIDDKSRPFIFLDEIQFVKNIPSVVKYLLDHHGWKFYLTGSSSFYLKNLFSESLAGRKIIYELFPLNFPEFLEFKETKVKIPSRATAPSHTIITTLYKEYVEFGGFPGVVAKTSIPEKNETLDDIFSSYFQKEIENLSGFRSNKSIRDLISLLAKRVGSRIEVQKLASELGLNRATVNEYLEFLQGTYFISLISPYSTNKDIEIRSAKKVYLCDSGMARHLGQNEFGKVFENTIYHQLRTQGEVRYYQRKSGVEIDFILNEKLAWEVKTKANKHDISQLDRLVKELGLNRGKVISFEYTNNPVFYGFQI